MTQAGDHGTQPHLQPHEQPGLEVVPDGQRNYTRAEDWSGLQVDSHPYYVDSGKEVISDHNDSGEIPVTSEQDEVKELESKQPRRRGRLWLMIGGIVLLLVTAAAIIGGMMRTKAANASKVDDSLPTSEASPTSTPTPTTIANTTTKLQSIRQGSPLAVTGWGQSGGVEVFLFYQDHDYQTPDKFNSFADASTRLGASVIQYDSSYQPQTEVFYTNDEGRVLGVSINEALSPNYEEDSIKSMVLSSRVNAEWDKKRLNATADSDSRLALVPLSANFSKIAVQGGYGIFYQAGGGLVASIPDLGSDELAADYADSWPTGFPTVTNMPGGAPFAAFSVPRSSDTLQRVFTYVLYLDNDANINVIYNDATSWITVQPAGLKGVDKDTEITCLIMATTYRDSFQQAVVLGEEAFNPRLQVDFR
ncbi:hypothetical protein BDP81DRAFT_404656 [Colletotrichum phormii]|uniref:Fucose-specific lectin n=1 Tax=Colletotrichum phormii TaxID=359342 RepID=A0AAI9ZVL4_9PEZI|nr:uncharacterized protein BDP81DRAFT_404656 [Colletotrichum phormii]KAK1638640.1 hypothetical protein BDP81DRAFT_404656 [Colletotrichum phormii]